MISKSDVSFSANLCKDFVLDILPIPFHIWLKIHTHSAHISKGWAMTTFNQFSVGCQGHTRFRSKILVLDSIKFSYFGPPTSIELKNHMKFMWNSRVVNCHSKPFMTDTKYLILWTRWIGPKILVTDSWVIQDLHMTFPA